MPWRGVTVSEQRLRFLGGYQLKYYSVTELADRFGVSRTTAYTHPGHQGKWINRFEEHGQSGFHAHSRRPHSCPWQTDQATVEELVKLRIAHPRWGPRKLLDLMRRRDLSSRYMLGCDAHPAISPEKSFKHFRQLFSAYGLPNRIRTDNGVPFASNALARLSQLSVWFIKLGIYPELPVLAD
jgi:hypothetical protein